MKKKRFSAEQVKTLESIYAIKNYPTASMRLEASVKTKLPIGKIQGWFSQKRLKSKSLSRENLFTTKDDLEEEEKEKTKLMAKIDNRFDQIESNENLTLVKTETIIPDFNTAPEKENAKTEKHKKKRKLHMKPVHAEVLKSFFKTNKYPTKAQKRDLAHEMGFPLTKVSVWFNNQRVKDRWMRGERNTTKENHSKQRKEKFESNSGDDKPKEEAKTCNSVECDLLVGCDDCN